MRGNKIKAEMKMLERECEKMSNEIWSARESETNTNTNRNKMYSHVPVVLRFIAIVFF